MGYLFNTTVLNNIFKKKFVSFFQIIHKKKGYISFGKIGKPLNEIFLNLTNHILLFYKDGLLISHLNVVKSIKELKIYG